MVIKQLHESRDKKSNKLYYTIDSLNKKSFKITFPNIPGRLHLEPSMEITVDSKALKTSQLIDDSGAEYLIEVDKHKVDGSNYQVTLRIASIGHLWNSKKWSYIEDWIKTLNMNALDNRKIIVAEISI